MAAPFASMGITLGCFVRNLVLYPHSVHDLGESGVSGEYNLQLPGTGLVDLGITLVLAGLAILWLVALVRFVRVQPRSMLTIVLGVLASLAFGFSAWQNWLMAYPVCNAF